MIRPIVIDELFQVNDNLQPVFVDGVIIIDDYYKNLEKIQKVLNRLYAPKWKPYKNSKNFIDYYDCRPVIFNYEVSSEYLDKIEYIGELIQKYYKETTPLQLVSKEYEFNFFKNIKVPPNNNFQHMPHRDSPYAGIIYLDNVCSGGLALYDNTLNIENTEHENIYQDVSNISKTIVEAKPNRLIIFEGERLHGGYIEDHNKYVSEWRQNEVFFLEKREDAPKSNKKSY